MSAAVYYFSGTGRSLAVARYIAGRLGAELREIGEGTAGRVLTAVVVFPVYCQNIPAPAARFLRGLDAERIAAAAVYGGISPGNTLYEAARLAGKGLAAGAYIPTGHTYLRQPPEFDKAALGPFIDKLKDGDDRTSANIPKRTKDALAYIFPGLRSRAGVRLTRLDGCNGCGVCTRSCPVGAMRGGRPGGNCIRCLRCVSVCPQKALEFSLAPVLSRYLEKRAGTPPAEVFV